MLRELFYGPMCMRLSHRERGEVERIGQMPETTVLSVELAGWLEKVHSRAKAAVHCDGLRRRSR